MINITKRDFKTLVFRPNWDFNLKNLKVQILNLLFREFSLVLNNNRLINELSDDFYKLISERISNSIIIVRHQVIKFLKELENFSKFMRCYKFRGLHNSLLMYRYVRIYLHKVHKLAPIFDYERAKKNLGTLQELLNRKSMYVHLTTQIALVIYITDLKSKHNIENRITQKTLRYLCACSAYAFHRTRNKLNLDYFLKK